MIRVDRQDGDAGRLLPIGGDSACPGESRRISACGKLVSVSTKVLRGGLDEVSVF